MAQEHGIRVNPDIAREDLLWLIYEAIEEEREDADQPGNPMIRLKFQKYHNLAGLESYPENSREYKLDDSYNENRIALMLRDPAWAFAYWDLTSSDYKLLRRKTSRTKLSLRVIEMSETSVDSKIIDFFDIPLSVNDRSRYINLPKTGTNYGILLCAIKPTSMRTLAKSNIIKSPHQDRMHGKGQAEFIESIMDDWERFQQELSVSQRIISFFENQYLG